MSRLADAILEVLHVPRQVARRSVQDHARGGRADLGGVLLNLLLQLMAAQDQLDPGHVARPAVRVRAEVQFNLEGAVLDVAARAVLADHLDVAHVDEQKLPGHIDAEVGLTGVGDDVDLPLGVLALEHGAEQLLALHALDEHGVGHLRRADHAVPAEQRIKQLLRVVEDHVAEQAVRVRDDPVVQPQRPQADQHPQHQPRLDDVQHVDAAGLDRQHLVVGAHAPVDDAGGEQRRRRDGVRQRAGDQERDRREDLRRAEPLLRRLGDDAGHEQDAGDAQEGDHEHLAQLPEDHAEQDRAEHGLPQSVMQNAECRMQNEEEAEE